ncbi:MAG: DNA-binding domain-containing protein [Caulobacteraceae bacterium]|nr:DNA-binding domain-containing protein [Caulobacteraceae bacterium]
MPEPLSELGRFQQAFATALAGDAAALAPFGLEAEAAAAGLSVHRNTVARGTIDALATSFPTVRRLVGEAWFEAAARAFIAERPPRERALIDYGGDFPDFLAAFEPAADLPYLAGVARLDRLWLEAHVAADAPAWTPAEAAAVAPEALFDLRPPLHPSARTAWFEALAVPTLWTLCRPPAAEPDAIELAARPEGVLLVRPHGAVEALVLDRASWSLLDACARGVRLGEAADTALAADPGADLPALLLRLVEAGAFSAPPAP